MDHIWFKKLGWAYVPVHPIGLLITFLCIVCNIIFYVSIDSSSSSEAATIREFFVYFTCVAFWWRWIAQEKS